MSGPACREKSRRPRVLTTLYLDVRVGGGLDELEDARGQAQGDVRVGTDEGVHCAGTCCEVNLPYKVYEISVEARVHGRDRWTMQCAKLRGRISPTRLSICTFFPHTCCGAKPDCASTLVTLGPRRRRHRLPCNSITGACNHCLPRILPS